MGNTLDSLQSKAKQSLGKTKRNQKIGKSEITKHHITLLKVSYSLSHSAGYRGLNGMERYVHSYLFQGKSIQVFKYSSIQVFKYSSIRVSVTNQTRECVMTRNTCTPCLQQIMLLFEDLAPFLLPLPINLQRNFGTLQPCCLNCFPPSSSFLGWHGWPSTAAATTSIHDKIHVVLRNFGLPLGLTSRIFYVLANIFGKILEPKKL